MNRGRPSYKTNNKNISSYQQMKLGKAKLNKFLKTQDNIKLFDNIKKGVEVLESELKTIIKT